MSKTIAVIIAVIVIVVGFIVAINFGVIPKKEYGPYDDFIICLKVSDVKFYGDYTNPDSLRQMSFFGDSLYVLEKSGVYVECNSRGANPKLDECNEKRLRTHPTWIVNGIKYEGLLGLNKIEEVTGCER